MICGYLDDLISYYEAYSAYLSDLSGHIRATVERAMKTVVCDELKNVVMNAKNKSGQQTTERGEHLKLEELAQLAVNANYLERSCSFFEGELATDDQLVDLEDVATGTTEEQKKSGDGEDPIPKMHSAREALKSVMSLCVDALFERLGLCVEDILERYTASVNWQ